MIIERIEVDPAGDVPVYMQIADQVRVGVATGQFRPGDRLEPVRELARRLAVNSSTVGHAYQLLEREGVIRTNRRGGSLIASEQDAGALEALGEARLRAMFERPVLEGLAQGYSPERVEAAFNLQMAVWRERRRQPRPGAGSVVGTGAPGRSGAGVERELCGQPGRAAGAPARRGAAGRRPHPG